MAAARQAWRVERAALLNGGDDFVPRAVALLRSLALQPRADGRAARPEQKSRAWLLLACRPCLRHDLGLAKCLLPYLLQLLLGLEQTTLLAQARRDPAMVERLVTQAKDAKGKDIYTRRVNDPTERILGLDGLDTSQFNM